MTTLPADLPIVDIALVNGVAFNVTVTFSGVMQITGVSSADYQTALERADAVAEGIYSVIDTYPIRACPDTEAEWRQAHPETGQPAELAQSATEPSEYWSES